MAILKQLNLIAIQSVKKKEYYLRIAEKVFPELKSGRFFAKVQGIEHYFSGLIQTEVKINYKSFYDEYDFAFSIRCTFSLCDKKNETRWVRQEGSEHFYSTPVLFVVDRTDFNYSPEQAVSRMIRHYRANTLVLGSYAHPEFSWEQLADHMRRNGIHLILQRELEGENVAIQSGFVFRHLTKPKKVSFV